MKKNIKIGLIIALALTNLGTMSTMIVIPIASNLYSTYSEGLVNYILSGSTLLSAVASFCAGYVIKKLGTKRFSIVMLLTCTIAGVLSAVVNSGIFLAAMQSVIGLAIGGLCVSNNVIIAENYEDVNLRGTILAAYRATQGLAAILLSTVAGALAATDWRNAFYAFLLCLPALILVLIILPSNAKKSENQSEGNSTKSADVKTRFPLKTIVPLNLMLVVFVLCYSLVYYQMGVLVVEKGITNTTLIGALSSIGMVGGIAGSFVFGFFAKKIKQYMPVICFGLMAVMFVMLYFTNSAVGIAFSAALISLSYNMNITYMFNQATVIVEPEHIGNSISITTFLQSIFAFLSTYFASGIKIITGAEQTVSTIPIIAVILAVGALGCLVYANTQKMSQA